MESPCPLNPERFRNFAFSPSTGNPIPSLSGTIIRSPFFVRNGPGKASSQGFLYFHVVSNVTVNSPGSFSRRNTAERLRRPLADIDIFISRSVAVPETTFISTGMFRYSGSDSHTRPVRLSATEKAAFELETTIASSSDSIL